MNVTNSRLGQHDLSRIGLFPLPNVVLFPAQILSLHVLRLLDEPSSGLDAAESADIVAGTLVEDPDERQALLEELDPCRRLTWLVAHVHGLGVRLAGRSALASERWN